jgi:hypothetical protein
MSAPYHNDLIKIQTKNLFDVPLDVETSFDNNNKVDMSEIEIGSGVLPMQGGGGGNVMRNINLESQFDDSDFDEVDLGNMSDSGEVEFVQKGGNDPQLFDKIELKRDDSHSFNVNVDKSDFTETIVPVKENMIGGNVIENNPDNNEMMIEDLDLNENEIEESGNVDNPGEDAPNADDSTDIEYDMENINTPAKWVHPELTIENDDEMVIKMNQDDVDSKVAMYMDYHNSDEYQKYLKYFQMIYSASSQKYSVRKDNEGNIYLIKRHSSNKNYTSDSDDEDKDAKKKKEEKKEDKKNKKDVKDVRVKGKSLKENVYDIINDTGFKKNYLIKLTPPEYINIQDELKKITDDLNVLSGEIRLMQTDLIELGMDIKKDDIRRFEKIRSKFYKLINKKHIYSKYFTNVNNLPDDNTENPEINNIFVNELISYEDNNDSKAFKLNSNMISVSTMTIDNIILQLKNNLENYSKIIENTENREYTKDTKDTKNSENNEYKKSIKDFLINKKINDDKTQKELNSIVTFSKGKINFIIKKLPIIDVKTEPN